MTMISDELLPCPFCGWQPDTENRPSHGTDIYCANETCGGARIVVSADETERHGEEAIHRWNTRTSPPPSGEAGEVTDEMVQAACDAYYSQTGFDWAWQQRRGMQAGNLAAMRAALVAALPTIKEPTDE
jgi:hypothetical protein